MGNNRIHTQLLELKSKIKDKSGWNAEKKIHWDAWQEFLDQAIERVENLKNEEKAYSECGSKNSPFPNLPTLKEEIEKALELEKESTSGTLKKPQIKKKFNVVTMGDFRQTRQE